MASYGLNNRKRRELTEKEINQIEAYSAVRLPMEDMAALLGISESYLEDMIKRNDAARHSLNVGRAKAKAKFRQRLYQLAMDGDIQAMKFWAVTQDGFRMPPAESSHPYDRSYVQSQTIDVKAIEYVPEETLNQKLELLMAKA